MQLEYDLTIGALYIRLGSAEISRTRELDDNTNIDLADDGTVIGIEVIDIDRPWPLAEVLRDYEVPPGEAAQLQSYFPFALPSVSAAPAAPARLTEKIAS